MSFDWWPRNSGKWIDLGRKLTRSQRCALNDIADLSHKLDADLPDNDQVAGMIGIDDVGEWRGIRGALLKVRAIKSIGRRIRIPLLMEAKANQKSVSEARSKAGRASGRARSASHMPQDCPPCAPRVPMGLTPAGQQEQPLSSNICSTTTGQDSSSRRTTTAVTEADLAVGLRLNASESETREAVDAMEDWAIANGEAIRNRPALLRKFILDARKRRQSDCVLEQVDTEIAKLRGPSEPVRVFDDSIHWDGECGDDADDTIPF
jgi:hypothetical protein